MGSLINRENSYRMPYKQQKIKYFLTSYLVKNISFGMFLLWIYLILVIKNPKVVKGNFNLNLI